MTPGWLYTLDEKKLPTKQWRAPLEALKGADPSRTKDVALFVMAKCDYNGAIERFSNPSHPAHNYAVDKVFSDMARHFAVICLVTESVELISYAVQKIDDVICEAGRSIRSVVIHAHSNNRGMGLKERLRELNSGSFSSEFFRRLSKDCILTFFGCETARGHKPFTEEISKRSGGRLCAGAKHDSVDMKLIAMKVGEKFSLIPLFTREGISPIKGSEAGVKLFKDGAAILDGDMFVSRL